MTKSQKFLDVFSTPGSVTATNSVPKLFMPSVFGLALHSVLHLDLRLGFWVGNSSSYLGVVLILGFGCRFCCRYPFLCFLGGIGSAFWVCWSAAISVLVVLIVRVILCRLLSVCYWVSFCCCYRGLRLAVHRRCAPGSGIVYGSWLWVRWFCSSYSFAASLCSWLITRWSCCFSVPEFYVGSY